MDEFENGHRILIGAPEEAEEIGQVLQEEGFTWLLCEDAATLASEMERGAGAVIVSEFLLRPGDGFRRLLGAIDEQQPDWSEIPLLVLIAAEEPKPPASWRDAFAGAILLPLPIRRSTLVSMAGAALRWRILQYRIRDDSLRRQSDEAMSLLDQRISEVAEEERRRIALDLHDSLGGLLSATDLRLRILVDAIAAGQTPRLEDAELVSKMIREGVAETRRLTHGLQPIGDNPDDLMSALGNLASTIRVHAAMDCRFECPDPVPMADPRIANELFRIAREAANNAVRHSGARNLTLRLFRRSGVIVLEIADDGRGSGLRKISVETGGLGLEIMKHRARSIGGVLDIESGNGGVTVSCRVPSCAVG